MNEIELNNSSRKFTKREITLAILVILLGGLFLWSLNVDKSDDGSAMESPTLPDTSSWQTYRNEEFGFEFKYEGDDPIVLYDAPNPDSAGEGPLTVYLYEDPSEFEWFLSDGAFGNTVNFDKSDKDWIVTPGLNTTKEDFFCPNLVYINGDAESPAIYQIGDPRSDIVHDYVFVTEKGIVVIEDFFAGDIVETLKFDDSNSVIGVGCVVSADTPWETYRDEGLAIEFSYPRHLVAQSEDFKGKDGVSLTHKGTLQYLSDVRSERITKNAWVDGPFASVIISYDDTIPPLENNEYELFGKTKVDGIDADELTVYNISNWYALSFEKNGYWLIEFPYVPSGDKYVETYPELANKLDDEKQKIIGSINFF